MPNPNDEVGRLDVAARALISEVFITRSRWFFSFVNLIILVVAYIIYAQFHTTTIASALALNAVLATMIPWLDWRYKLYFLALMYFAVTIECFLLPKSILVREHLGHLLQFAFLGAAVWVQAGPYASAHASGWERERSLVRSWWQIMAIPERSAGIIEFTAESFWSGNYTYRLMSPGPYWAVARRWKGWAKILENYRIRELSAVSFVTLPTGETTVTIGRRTMRAVNVSPPGFEMDTASSQP